MRLSKTVILVWQIPVSYTHLQIHYKNTNVGGRLSVSGRYKPAGGFLSSLDYNLSAQMSRTVDSHDNWVNNPDGLVTTAREPGVHVAQIRNVGYTSAYRCLLYTSQRWPTFIEHA